MGAGFYPAGGSPGGPYERAGVDPDYVPSPIVPLAEVDAILFDPALRQFVMNSDGTFASIHPVDQIVAIRLWLQQGEVPSAPTLGNRIRARTARVAQATIPQIVTDEVTRTLRDLIDAGDIQLVAPKGLPSAVVVDSSLRGVVKYAVYYRNLRLPNSKIRKATS